MLPFSISQSFWAGLIGTVFFGAGETMALAAASGQIYPAVVTFGIALILSAWATYALSGAGVLKPLPFLKSALIIITAIYLVRGLGGIPLYLFMHDSMSSFDFWSSIICLGYGLVHLLGLRQIWETL